MARNRRHFLNVYLFMIANVNKYNEYISLFRFSNRSYWQDSLMLIFAEEKYIRKMLFSFTDAQWGRRSCISMKSVNYLKHFANLSHIAIGLEIVPRVKMHVIIRCTFSCFNNIWHIIIYDILTTYEINNLVLLFFFHLLYWTVCI